MKQIIYKYNITDTAIAVTKFYKILDVQLQNSVPVIWILIDKDVAKTELIHLELFSTGENFEYSEHREYIRTFQQGLFVWHLFNKYGKMKD